MKWAGACSNRIVVISEITDHVEFFGVNATVTLKSLLKLSMWLCWTDSRGSKWGRVAASCESGRNLRVSWKVVDVLSSLQSLPPKYGACYTALVPIYIRSKRWSSLADVVIDLITPQVIHIRQQTWSGCGDSATLHVTYIGRSSLCLFENWAEWRSRKLAGYLILVWVGLSTVMTEGFF